MIDYCAVPLDLRASPVDTAMWRMRCTIKKLDAERAEAEDRATQMEVNGAVSAANLRAMQAQDAALAKSASKLAWWESCAKTKKCLAWVAGVKRVTRYGWVESR